MPRMEIPVIGIGAGGAADGQVLVFHDLLGIYDGHVARFVKRYANVRDEMIKGVSAFADEVRARSYPEEEHGYTMAPDEIARLHELLREQHRRAVHGRFLALAATSARSGGLGGHDPISSSHPVPRHGRRADRAVPVARRLSYGLATGVTSGREIKNNTITFKDVQGLIGTSPSRRLPLVIKESTLGTVTARARRARQHPLRRGQRGRPAGPRARHHVGRPHRPRPLPGHLRSRRARLRLLRHGRRARPPPPRPSNGQITASSLGSNINGVDIRTDEPERQRHEPAVPPTRPLLSPLLRLRRVLDAAEHLRGCSRRDRVRRDVLVTTLLAPITHRSPMVTPLVTTTFAPHQTLSPMRVGPLLVNPCQVIGLSGSSKRWFESVTKQPFANMQWSPISTSSPAATMTPMLRNEPCPMRMRASPSAVSHTCGSSSVPSPTSSRPSPNASSTLPCTGQRTNAPRRANSRCMTRAVPRERVPLVPAPLLDHSRAFSTRQLFRHDATPNSSTTRTAASAGCASRWCLEWDRRRRLRPVALGARVRSPARGHAGSRADGLLAPRGPEVVERAEIATNTDHPAISSGERRSHRYSGSCRAAGRWRGLTDRFPSATDRGYRWVADHRSSLGRLLPGAVRRWADRVISESRRDGR